MRAGELAPARRSRAPRSRILDAAIRELVLPHLGLELGRWAAAHGRDLASDGERRDLEAAALTFVFRALFLLYAESAGYLPMWHDVYARGSLTRIVQDAWEQRGRFDARSTKLWDRLQTLTLTMHTGDEAGGVPPYGGDLFARDGFDGSATLAAASLPDDALGPSLVAMGIDAESGLGYDFSGLAIGQLGHIYEGLLSLHLSLADRAYPGELLWLAEEGRRKGGGVYYTPQPLVRHLVHRGVLPAFERHLEGVLALVADKPGEAARRLFEFRVLDPACGSAHFLVAVVDALADRIARFLAEHPLRDVARELDDLRACAEATSGIDVEDAALLRRLVLRRCVYGVDLSPMGAEIAKISLSLASFVPGLSPVYLDHNVRVGNSLVGVAGAGQLADPAGCTTIPAMLVLEQMDRAARAAEALHSLLDRDPDEVALSEAAEARIQCEAAGARMLFDLWAAEPLGLAGARAALRPAAEAIGKGLIPPLADAAASLAQEHRVLHWPLAFPEVFANGGGFDAVVGNPPWEEVKVEDLEFFARYQPGLEGMRAADRATALAALKLRRPELAGRFDRELALSAALRAYLGADAGFDGSPGDPDLYKFFCQRYRRLLGASGALAVVLPRGAFVSKGSAGFRSWLFGESTVNRLDFLLNSGRWAFDAEPRYTVALLEASAKAPPPGHRVEVAGVAASAAEFDLQSRSPGIVLEIAALGPELEVPLLPTQAAADLLAKLRGGSPFPLGAGRWKAMPVTEFHETNDRRLWEGHDAGWRLWKGESFDQYDPSGAGERRCQPTEPAMLRARKANPGMDSLVADSVARIDRVAAALAETGRARVAFRGITNRTNSRTVIACVVPPETFLANSSPYLAFVDGDDQERAAAVGLLNSLPFDWQARRFVEVNLNFFILEGLRVPTFGDAAFSAIAAAAARLSCPDERYGEFAAATGVEVGPLAPDERDRLRAEIDAQVAVAWGLDAADLETVFADFTLDAVPAAYRQLVRDRVAELA